MKSLRVAVLAESETDDAVAREIVAHVRQVAVESVPVLSLRTRGWPAVVRQLPQVVHTVYYHSDADALIVLADTDTEVPHEPRTHAPASPRAGCRWCELNAALRGAMSRLREVPGRTLRTGIGTPVPAVEAWLLADHAARPSEAAWLQQGAAGKAGAVAYKRKLKQLAYGSANPRADVPADASALIRRVLAIPGVLRTAFPGGYGPLEDAIRAW